MPANAAIQVFTIVKESQEIDNKGHINTLRCRVEALYFTCKGSVDTLPPNIINSW